MAWWFGRKSAPETRPLVPAWLTGEGIETGGFPRGYEAQLDEVYRRNPVGLRAVRLVAEAVGGLTVIAEEGGPSTGSGQAAVALVGPELMERAAAALLLHGNAYVQLIPDGRDRPGELQLLRPERVSVATDAGGWPAAYVYRLRGNTTRIARTDPLGRVQVAHVRGLHPGDDHYDPARDYQAGQMRASSGEGGARDERIELPAVLTAEQARTMVEQGLARRWRSGDRLRLRLPPGRLGLRPGDAVQIPGASRAWVARTVSIEGLTVAVEAEAAAASIVPLPADPGRPVSEPDLPIGRSELALFELPSPGDAPAAETSVYVAASNMGAWKPIPVELLLDGGSLIPISLGRRAIIGRSETVLQVRTPLVHDELSQVVVRLVNPAHILLNADQDALMTGANLAILGDELIQFGRAEQIGAGLYRLSSLLRGRRGTEWAAAGHAVGETFCLIDLSAVRSIELAPGATGATLVATAYGVGDTAPLPAVQLELTGEALRPPSPCHLRLWRESNELKARWTRRSHRGWAWADGVGVAEDPFPERYRVRVDGPSGQVEVDANGASAAFDVGTLPGQAGQTITASIAMIGPMALSHPVSADFTL